MRSLCVATLTCAFLRADVAVVARREDDLHHALAIDSGFFAFDREGVALCADGLGVGHHLNLTHAFVAVEDLTFFVWKLPESGSMLASSTPT